MSASLDGSVAAPAATAARLGEFLGSALVGRVDEVSQRVLRMWRARSAGAASAATSRVEDDIVSNTSMSTRALAEYLLHGEALSREQSEAIAATGKAPLRDTIPLAELTKLYLYWREITIATLVEEARRHAIGARDIEYAVAVVRGASDRSVVQMTKQFDAERTRLQDELATEQARLSHLAYHDALTGLPNRRLFFDRLSHALELRRRQRSGIGLLFIDVDSFKVINDEHGHRVGDQVLVATAQSLVTAARASDTVARFGGDEFVILCENPDLDAWNLVALVQRISTLLATGVSTDKTSVAVAVSIGIATAVADEDGDELIRRADGAMYVAKQRGPGNLHIWNDIN